MTLLSLLSLEFSISNSCRSGKSLRPFSFVALAATETEASSEKSASKTFKTNLLTKLSKMIVTVIYPLISICVLVCTRSYWSHRSNWKSHRTPFAIISDLWRTLRIHRQRYDDGHHSTDRARSFSNLYSTENALNRWLCAYQSEDATILLCFFRLLVHVDSFLLAQCVHNSF